MPASHLRVSVVALCVFGFMLSACRGTGTNDSGSPGVLPQSEAVAPLATTPAATPMPSTIVLKEGAVIGLDNQFTPHSGDTSSGGRGGTIDGLSCLPSMVENQYHVHAFIGLLVNGRQIAIPDQIGLVDPGTPINGYTNTAHCFYGIHTHDTTGMIHFEVASSAPPSSAVFTLGNVLDVWGETISATHFGPFSGTVRVFYAYTPLRSLNTGSYAQYTGSAPRNLRIYSHFAIWIQVGSTYIPAAKLPQIRFYTEY